MGRKLGFVAKTMAVAAALSLMMCSSDDDSVADGSKDGNKDDLFDNPGVDPTPENCGELQVTFKKRVPFVMILVDQSGSMEQDFGNGTRWQVMRNALLDESNGVLKLLEDDVRFGLALYTSEEGFQGGTCPMINDVGAEFGNYNAIRALYDAASPSEDTPTGESITEIAKAMEKIHVEEVTPKVIILATDGHPDTCAEPDPQNGQPESLAAAQDAFGRGIQTFVISVGDEIGNDHLQDMANAGAGLPVNGPTNMPFWIAYDQAELYDAFTTIINGVRDCVFTLDGHVVPGYEDEGAVLLDGEPLDKDDPNGWKLNNNKEIQLLGEACELLQNGDHSVTVDFPCGGYEPPPIY